MIYDVLIIGSGPAGIYTSIILKRGIPTQNAEENIKVGVLEKDIIGGLTRYAHIQISKKWSFSGSNLMCNLYEEAKSLNVSFYTGEIVIKIIRKSEIFEVITENTIYKARFVVLANGILSTPSSLNSEKVIIGLHNAKYMIDDIKEKNWKRIILYGSYEELLIKLKEDLLQYDYLDDIKIIIEPIESYEEGYLNLAIEPETMNYYEGILIDYNSYKILNSSTPKIDIKGLKTDLGFIYTNNFCETNINNLYAVGTNSNIITGVPICLSTGQIAALDIGRKINKEIISEPSGRFPWFPREENWDASWLNILKNKNF